MSYIIARITKNAIDIIDDENGLNFETGTLADIIKSGKTDFYYKFIVDECIDDDSECFQLTNLNRYKINFESKDFKQKVNDDFLSIGNSKVAAGPDKGAESKGAAEPDKVAVGSKVAAEPDKVDVGSKVAEPKGAESKGAESKYVGADLNIHQFKELIVGELNKILKKEVPSENVTSEKKNILPQFKELIVDELKKIFKNVPSKEEKYIFLPKFKELIVEELNKILPTINSAENKRKVELEAENKRKAELEAENKRKDAEAENKRKVELEAENKKKEDAMLKNDSIGMQVPQNSIDSDFDNLLKSKMQFYSDINLNQKTTLNKQHKTGEPGPMSHHTPNPGIPIYVNTNDWNQYIEDAKYEKVTDKINYKDGINYYLKEDNGKYNQKNGKILSVTKSLFGKLTAKLTNNSKIKDCNNCYIKKTDKNPAKVDAAKVDNNAIAAKLKEEEVKSWGDYAHFLSKNMFV